MTTRNSILLIIKQQPGIEYNALLNKIAPDYGSVESARAALSRAIRYLAAIGLIQRHGNRLFSTAKGAATLNREMSNKLLLRLNQAVKGKDAPAKVDSIVEMLQTLIERSKADRDLLRAAKGSADFYLSDLSALAKDVGKKAHTLHYLGEVLSQQMQSLQELDFPDSVQMPFSPASKEMIGGIANKVGEREIVAEFPDSGFQKKAAQAFEAKTRHNTLSLNAEALPRFLNFVENNSREKGKQVSLYLVGIKILIDYPKIFITAPSSRLEKMLGKGKAPVV